ncbi:hypothetical protein HO133_011037 [Letharia lupina]|uniref:Uncharacterized protein n=1 Tax=Letharia lupina TaxID=560253 RepID=A0A8H6CIY0_9LECA|nr:uncharacterized protein HO133_011037 [Letharia lupina]KAF6224460.1 hypothetical protein HO133_011037 [Letharia lupina]
MPIHYIPPLQLNFTTSADPSSPSRGPKYIRKYQNGQNDRTVQRKPRAIGRPGKNTRATNTFATAGISQPPNKLLTFRPESPCTTTARPAPYSPLARSGVHAAATTATPPDVKTHNHPAEVTLEQLRQGRREGGTRDGDSAL